ncbi:MAG: DegT/DnrJ/EryC1/StrS aminotransferase family protein [Mariprofundaceae bacterium]|nr:DegT/DnrJ/EryC1/StrS aminotransferase family protein [Mariprofundaceae bacterium]
MNADFPSWPHYDQDEIDAVAQVLRSGKVNYWTGDQGRCFEREFADYIGCRYGIALANGTVALEAALHALSIGPGDEVIVPTRTFIASASCVAMRGARPVVADVDSESGNITTETIEKVRTPQTKAVIAVHLGGWPCDMDTIMAYAREHGLKVIEDCAQAHGAEYKGRKAGSFGDAAAFSFCQDKIMSTGGEGGMLVTNSEKIRKKVWSVKDHGKDYELVREPCPESGFRWLHHSFGTNWRMTEMQAAIGRIQLKKLPLWLEQRRTNALALFGALRGVPGLAIPTIPSHINPAFYRAYVFVEPSKLKSTWNRDRIIREIDRQGVPRSYGSCCEIYREQAFVHAGYSPDQPLAVARLLGDTFMCFSVHPGLETLHMEKIASTVCRVMEEAAETC